MSLSEAVLSGTGFVSRRDAIYVLQNVTGCTHEDILLRGNTILCKMKLAEFERKIKRIADGEPLQYVLGKWDFCGIEFIVDKRALIPRPETELLVEAVISHIQNKQRLDILDVCTGSGCIGLSIAELSGFRHNIVLADVSDQALSLAKENYLRVLPASTCKSLQEVRFLRGISIFQSNLLDDIPGEYDVIVSNPPYIRSGDMKSLPENVKNHEPHLALDGGDDGLAIYKKLIPQSYDKLKPGGMLFLEIGPSQTIETMQNFGFINIEIRKDYAGVDRILQGVKSNV